MIHDMCSAQVSDSLQYTHDILFKNKTERQSVFYTIQSLKLP